MRAQRYKKRERERERVYALDPILLSVLFVAFESFLLSISFIYPVNCMQSN